MLGIFCLPYAWDTPFTEITRIQQKHAFLTKVYFFLETKNIFWGKTTKNESRGPPKGGREGSQRSCKVSKGSDSRGSGHSESLVRSAFLGISLKSRFGSRVFVGFCFCGCFFGYI